MISFVKKYLILFNIILLTGCSLDKKSGIWTGFKNVESTENELIKITKDKNIIKNELNPDLKIYLKTKTKVNQQWLSSDLNNQNLLNHLSLENNIRKIGKFKFKKTVKRRAKEPDVIISKDFIIFYDNNGSFFKFDQNSKLKWKTRVYTKKERNHVFNTSMVLANEKIFVADNLGKYFSIDLKSGEVIWSKRHRVPFNSQMKAKDNKIYIIDTDNTLLCISTKNGSIIWNLKTQNTLIKTLKKLSLVTDANYIYFSNSLGDITKADLKTGDLVWQMPTQNTILKSETNFLKMSDIVLDKDSLYISNNNTSFYSLDKKTGLIKWIQGINSFHRPIIIDGLIFTISEDGYLVVIDSIQGNVIRINYLFNRLRKRARRWISVKGFIIASNKIYVSTNTGRLFIYNLSNLEINDIYKIERSNAVSEPFINNNKLYLFKSNAIVVLN